MAATSSPEEPFAVAYASSGSKGRVLHLRPDCRGLHAAEGVREVDPSAFPNWPLCKYCDPDVDMKHGPGVWGSGTQCHSCHGPLENGRCEFCERMEAIL